MGKNEAQIKTLLVKRLLRKSQEAKGKIAPNSEANSTLDKSNKQTANSEPIINDKK